MKRALLLLLLSSSAGCAAAGSAAVGVGDRPELQALQLSDMEGRRQELLGEEPVALVFWQSWCAACRREAPSLARAAGVEGEEIRFLGVIPGRPDVVDDEEVRAAAKSWGYTFPQIRDADMSLSRLLGVKGTPTIVILGPEGVVRHHGPRPPRDWSPFRAGAAEPPRPEPE